MIKVEMDQPVVILDGHGRGLRSWRGKVVKIGRIWIEVEKDDCPGWAPVQLRLDTQTDGSQSAHGARFYTLDQWAKKERRDEATAFLREQGIDVRHGSPWRNREADLADAIRKAATTS